MSIAGSVNTDKLSNYLITVVNLKGGCRTELVNLEGVAAYTPFHLPIFCAASVMELSKLLSVLRRRDPVHIF